MKGFGYIIEGFASGIMLLLFLGGALLAYQPSATDWVDYRTEVSANDLSYVSEVTGDVERLVDDGETGSLETLYRSYSSGETSVETVEHDFLTEPLTAGIYVPEADRHTVSLTEVQSGDRCHGELSEIEADDIFRTEAGSGSLEDEHGVRLYIAENPDSLEEFSSMDYGIYVDNGTECNFATEDGPFLKEEMFFWGDRTNDEGSSYYEIPRIDTDNEEMDAWETELAGEIRERARRSGYRNQGMMFDGFNQTELQETLPYDIVVFHGNEQIEVMDNNPIEIERILQSSVVVLVADIEEDDLDSGFLSNTGLRWVDLDTPSDTTARFSDSVEGVRMNQHFNSVGCYSCGALEKEPGGTVSSSSGNYIDAEDQRLVLQNIYDTSDWDAGAVLNEDEDADEDNLLESECDPGHWSGDIEFAEEGSETEELTVYSTELGLDETDCNNEYAVQIDFEGNGELSDPILEQGGVEIFDREYVVDVTGGEDVEFSYAGDSTVELVNYREQFSERDIEGFARVGNITENGELGGETGENLVMLTALLFEMGRSPSSGTSDAGVQTFESGISDDVPYSYSTRWDR